MISFILIAVAMLAVAILVLAPALLGKGKVKEIDRTQQNVLIAKEQIAALEQDLADCVIEAPQFDEQKSEIERNLLSDVNVTETGVSSAISGRARIWSISLVAIFTVMISTGLYLQLGTPEVMQLADEGKTNVHASKPAGPAGTAPVNMEQSINKLKARLFDNPDDLEGWFLLGRSYMSMGRYQESADAMGKVYAKVQNHAGVILGYADALAMANGGKLAGKPFELVQQALALEPNNATGLWLSGLAYEEQGQFKQALASFKKLKPQLTDANSSARVNQLIAKMETQLGLPPSKDEPQQLAASAGGIDVVVMASDQVMAKLSGNEMVFIYAKAMQGLPMPLAAKRISVKELPITIRLDDSMAMMPQMKLSNFELVKVGARISKSGNAIAAKGDFIKEVSSVKSSGGGKVTLIVDGVVE